MSIYKNMFDGVKPQQPAKRPGLFDNVPAPAQAAPTPPRNLFGQSLSQTDTSRQSTELIGRWLSQNSITQTTANRIKFILNGVDVEKLTANQITDIGKFHVDEATEANKCVDQVVTDYAAMKTEVDGPKTLLLGAIALIEGGSKPPTFLERLKGIKPVDWTVLRKQVKSDIDQANDKMKSVLKYHLDPFISGLAEAKTVINTILQDLDNTVNTLNYLIDTSKDAMIQDLARRRKEMFSKSHALMLLNKSQLDNMAMACEKNKLFATELEMNLKPLIENVMRSALIDDTDSQTAMQNIQSKLKGIL